MLSKDKLRKKFIFLRKKKYFSIKKKFFHPLKKIINFKKRLKISLYYPSNYELDTLPLFNLLNKTKFTTSLPKLLSNGKMNFVKWNIPDPLMVNKYGFLEPLNSSQIIIPEILIVPLVAFDKNRNRLGYGKGYYDKFINKYVKKKNLLTIGLAFSFQEYKKIPTNNLDKRLDYIITNKGIL